MTRTGWLLSGTIVQSLTSAVVGVVLARLLGVAEFGTYSALVVGTALLATLGGFRLELHLVTELRGEHEDRGRYAQVIKAAYLVTVPVCAVALTLVIILLGGRLRLLAGIAVGEALVSPLLLARVALQVGGRQRGIAAAGLAGRATWALSVAAIAVLTPRHALAWVMVGRVAAVGAEAACLAGLAHLPMFRWLWEASGSVRSCLGVLRASLPLAVSGVSGLGYDRIDQLLLTGLNGPLQTGLYAAGVRVAEVLGLLPPLVQNVTLPGLIQLRRCQDHRGFDYALADSLLLMLVPVGALLVVLLDHGGQLALSILGSAYRGTGAMIAVLAVAEGLRLVGTAYSSAALAVGARSLFVGATVAGLAVNVALNIVLVPRFGGLGAAWASLVSYGAASAVKLTGHPELRRSCLASAWVLIRVAVAILLADGAGTVAGVPLAGSIAITTAVYVTACCALLPAQTRRVLRRAIPLHVGT